MRWKKQWLCGGYLIWTATRGGSEWPNATWRFAKCSKCWVFFPGHGFIEYPWISWFGRWQDVHGAGGLPWYFSVRHPYHGVTSETRESEHANEKRVGLRCFSQRFFPFVGFQYMPGTSPISKIYSLAALGVDWPRIAFLLVKFYSAMLAIDNHSLTFFHYHPLFGCGVSLLVMLDSNKCPHDSFEKSIPWHQPWTWSEPPTRFLSGIMLFMCDYICGEIPWTKGHFILKCF